MTVRSMVMMSCFSLGAACSVGEEQTPAPGAGYASEAGFQMGLVTGSIYDDLVANAGARMADFASLGVKMLRVEIIGGDFTKYRRIVDAAARYGIQVLAVVQSNAVDRNLLPDINAYTQEYIRVVDRLLAEIPSLRYIEVENEPDVYDFNPLSGDNVFRYASLVTQVFEHYVTHRKDGRPQIVAFDFSRQDQPAFDAVYNAGPITNHRNYFRQAKGLPDGLPADIVSIHAYGEKTLLPNEPNYSYGNRTMDDAVRGFLDRKFQSPPARNDSEQSNTSVINQTPVWYTEVGHDRIHLGGEERQATALHQAFQTLKRYPQIKAAFWYDYRDDEGGDNPEHAGLRGNSTTGFAQRQAWAAYQQEAGVGSRTTFFDVPVGHFAYGAVEALYARGITRGCGGSYADGTLEFCRENNVSVDEIRVMIARAKGQSPDGPYASPAASRSEMARQLAQAIGASASWDGFFVDVGPNDENVREIYGLANRYTADGQRLAQGMLITDPDGVTRRYFGPRDPLTRAQMATFLSRAYQLH